MSQMSTDLTGICNSKSSDTIQIQLKNGICHSNLFSSNDMLENIKPAEIILNGHNTTANAEDTNNEERVYIDEKFLQTFTNDLNKILQLTKADVDPIFYKYIKSIPAIQLYKGILLQGFLMPFKLIKGLEDFTIKSDDIIIASYPKSGTTWTEEIVSILNNGGNIEKCRSKNLIERVIHLEVGRPIFPLTYLNNLRSPRLLATHFAWHLLPRGMQRDPPKCKIIYIARNPKDNAVSYFHHHRIASFLGNYQGTWDEFYHLFEQGKLVYGSWFEHVARYWEASLRYPDKILFLKYEDMKRDLIGEVRKIIKFLGMSLSPERLDQLVDHCSFESMKDNAMVNRENLPIKVFDLSETKFMRKGIVGDWKNYFSAAQNVSFDAIYNDWLSYVKTKQLRRKNHITPTSQKSSQISKHSLHSKSVIEISNENSKKNAAFDSQLYFDFEL